MVKARSIPMNPPHRIAPSLLSADFARLGEEVRAIEAASADWVHFDVMDNHYVPALTVGPLVCRALRPHTRLPIDVHLMVRPVDALIVEFAEAGANSISFHPEASDHVDRSLQLIRDRGCWAGLAFNPATPLHWLDHQMHRLDLILLMSVNPGFGGQRFLGSTLAKLAQVRARIDAHQHNDGGRLCSRLMAGSGSTTSPKLRVLGRIASLPAHPCLASPTPTAAIAALSAACAPRSPVASSSRHEEGA